MMSGSATDRKSTRPNSSHTDIYTLSLHDALPIYLTIADEPDELGVQVRDHPKLGPRLLHRRHDVRVSDRSEEHTSELQPHRYLHSFPTRRSSDLPDHRRRTRRAWCSGA